MVGEEIEDAVMSRDGDLVATTDRQRVSGPAEMTVGEVRAKGSVTINCSIAYYFEFIYRVFYLKIGMLALQFLTLWVEICI